VDGYEHWDAFGVTLILLGWAFFMRGRANPQPHLVLRACTHIGCIVAFFAFLIPFGGRIIPDDAYAIVATRATVLTAACVLLEILVSPVPERIPRAIARDRPSSDRTTRRS
jgi:hypothetical protein